MYVVSFSFYQKKKKISVSDWKRFHEAFSQCISVTNWWDHVKGLNVDQEEANVLAYSYRKAKCFFGNRCARLLSVSRCQALCWSRCPLPVETWGELVVWEGWQELGEVCSLRSCPPSILQCSAASTHPTSSFSWWEAALYVSEGYCRAPAHIC